MRAAVLTRAFDAETGTQGKVECLEWPTPEIECADDVLIRVAYASICGSDKHYIKDNLFPDDPPFVIGHEFSGVVDGLGEGAAAKGFAVGDRVTGDFLLECGHCRACRTGQAQFCEAPSVTLGMQAEYIVLKADQVFHVPDSVPLEVASLTEPFAISVNAIMRAGSLMGKSVMVIGAGSIGQMLVQLARISGAAFVGASARTDSKLDLAKRMGADFVVNPKNEDFESVCLEATGRRGFDVVIEASGAVPCIMQGIDVAARGGQVIMVSYYDPEATVPIPVFRKMVEREVALKGMQLGQTGWPYAISMLSRVDLMPIVSKIYDLSEVEQAYADLMEGSSLKILLKCS